MKLGFVRTAAGVLFLTATCHGFVERSAPDPEFAKVPFAQWVAEGGTSPFKLTTRVFPVQLSVHQRWLARVDLTLDGAQLAQLRGKGQMIILFQVQDGENGIWQDHGSIDLENLQEGVKASNVVYSEYFFVLPGDYRLSMAAYNTENQEHGVRKEKLHVPVLKNDPLPELWRDLPAVEFRPAAEPPDAWYLPALAGRLRLDLTATKVPRLEMLVNITPSERLTGSQRAQSQTLGSLLPALKIFTQADRGSTCLNVSFLDLSRQRVGFHQEQVGDLNWAGIKDFLTEAQPGTIDVKSLGARQNQARFFVSEVARRLEHLQNPVLIVLSGAVAFESGEDLRPIHLEGVSSPRVYYFRFHAPPPRPLLPLADARGRPRMGFPRSRFPDRNNLAGEMPDQLAATLKPLSPKLFDIQTPEQFRKALAAVRADLARTGTTAR